MFKTLAISAALLAIVGATALVSVAGIVAMTAEEAPKPAMAQAVETHNELTALESRLFVALNRYRCSRGGRPLLLDMQLTAAARDRSVWYAMHGINHLHIADGRTVVVDAQLHHFRGNGWGENTAQGQPSPESAVFDAWQHSPGHDANMRRPMFNCVGIAVEGRTYVTVFGHR